MSIPGEYQVFDSADQLAIHASDFIIQTIQQCLQTQTVCRVALPGGSTPASCLSKLAVADLPWQSIDWYMGDERCLPEGNAERNDVMIKKTLLYRNDIALQHFYPMEAEKGAAYAAEAYSQLIQQFERFDLVMLGMGEDGHTASLFPDNAALDDNRPVVPVENAPKPPSERVSLSMKTLQKATTRVVLAAGESKKPVISQIKAGKAYPVSCIGPNHWFVDRAADR